MNDVMMNLFSNQIIFVFVFGHQNTIRSPLICQLDIIKFDHIKGLVTLFLVRISAIMLDCFHDLLRLFISYMDGCENVDELVKGKRGHLSKEPASALKFKTCHFHSD